MEGEIKAKQEKLLPDSGRGKRVQLSCLLDSTQMGGAERARRAGLQPLGSGGAASTKARSRRLQESLEAGALDALRKRR